MVRASTVGTATLALALAALAACSRGNVNPHSLHAIRARGTITILTRNAPTTYYIGRDGRPTGPEYDMASAFATSIGVKAKFVVKDSVGELLAALASGKADMIAAGLTRTETRSDEFGFGPAYQNVTQKVVCRRGSTRPDSVAELAKVNLEVIADSSYVERLQALKKKHPGLSWKTAHDEGTEELLRDVWEGTLDCTVADSDIYAVNRRYYPGIVATFDLDAPQQLAWVVPKSATGLQAAMRRWLAAFRAQGKLAQVMKRYYAPAKVFDYVDTRSYVRKIEHLYPRYATDFAQAAGKHDLPPLVLAAQAYQESHWNPRASSPTGVRGMMMLTLDTAHSVGVSNRLDPRESIAGGARYLARLRGRLSDSIRATDRIWFALAAYNIGLAHVRDARRLARQLGKDPDAWNDVRSVLPLLGEKRYYRKLPHGYARGTEPVRYVRRIRYYADILREKTGRMSPAPASSVAPTSAGAAGR